MIFKEPLRKAVKAAFDHKHGDGAFDKLISDDQEAVTTQFEVGLKVYLDEPKRPRT